MIALPLTSWARRSSAPCPRTLQRSKVHNQKGVPVAPFSFSKKLANHCHMIAVYAVWYNFVRFHKTLRVTPAMAPGIVDQLWSVEKIVGLVDEWEAASRESTDAGGIG